MMLKSLTVTVPGVKDLKKVLFQFKVGPSWSDVVPMVGVRTTVTVALAWLARVPIVHVTRPLPGF